MFTPVQKRTVNGSEALVYLPGHMLYRLAFSPRKISPKHIQESLLKDGWLPEYPAEMKLAAGTYPLIDGCHRLGFLHSIGKLDLLVPTKIILVH